MRTTPEYVAVILAVGISVSLVMLTGAGVWALIGGLDANVFRLWGATQVLTGWGGGILGVLGAYIGYTFGKGLDDGS